MKLKNLNTENDASNVTDKALIPDAEKVVELFYPTTNDFDTNGGRRILDPN